MENLEEYDKLLFRANHYLKWADDRIELLQAQLKDYGAINEKLANALRTAHDLIVFVMDDIDGLRYLLARSDVKDIEEENIKNEIQKILNKTQEIYENLMTAGKEMDELEKQGETWDKTVDYNYDDADRWLYNALYTLKKALQL